MKSYIGFIFTESPIQNLEQRGFHFLEKQDTLTQGYKSFCLHLPDSQQQVSQIQLRQIMDEEAYLQYHKVQHFQPHWIQDSVDIPPAQKKRESQKNSVHFLNKSVGPQDLAEGKLKTYLQLRKSFDLWALWLQCQDLTVFEQKAQPDQLFEVEGKKTALIHLGPNCFDFLISAEEISSC